ncbi:MAG TPA: hypothetical protein DCE42_03415 [Myxococcales bacterium]|nr:hypothetical protein [Deltaproteobacteria bacterium]MBU50060.1 hypothetical protein [Deltaproteobacteria bacterium]HAA53772.1 hypothetical protein [Myxococcales bacterium]
MPLSHSFDQHSKSPDKHPPMFRQPTTKSAQTRNLCKTSKGACQDWPKHQRKIFILCLPVL